MEADDKTVKEKLIDTIKNIKEKYRSLQQEENSLNERMNSQYRPIIKPLNEIVANVSKSNDVLKVERKVSSGDKTVIPLQKIKYINLNDFLSIMDTKESDSKYGIKKSKRGVYKIGQTIVDINNQNIKVSGEAYKLTTGLMNLLFLKSPMYYTNGDLINYKKIIEETKIHLNNQMKLKTDDSSFKFKHIIYPLFVEDDIVSGDDVKMGKSLQTNYMQLLLDKKIDYKYWDDVNELVDRLRLLIASQAAGHNGHNNEVIAIIEELKESNIVI